MLLVDIVYPLLGLSLAHVRGPRRRSILLICHDARVSDCVDAGV